MISNVALLRNRVGLTQTDLSKKVGVSRRALSSIEKGTAKPSVDVALRLAAVLNTSVEDLFAKMSQPPLITMKIYSQARKI